MKISTQKEIIIKLLTEKPELRDNDNKLIANIWWRQITEEEKKDTFRFMKSFANGKITSPESIRRCRQKLQEENPELRGKLYEERHKERIVVRDEIKEWDRDVKQSDLFQ